MESVADYAAINGALQGYRVADQEAGATSYFGYVNNKGEWYLMRSVKTDAVTAYRFYKGDGDYATAWAARGDPTYDYFYNVFGGG